MLCEYWFYVYTTMHAHMLHFVIVFELTLSYVTLDRSCSLYMNWFWNDMNIATIRTNVIIMLFWVEYLNRPSSLFWVELNNYIFSIVFHIDGHFHYCLHIRFVILVLYFFSIFFLVGLLDWSITKYNSWRRYQICLNYGKIAKSFLFFLFLFCFR